MAWTGFLLPPEAAAAAAPILAGVVPPWEYAEYGTHLLAALLVEMAGQHHYQMRTWGHGDSRGQLEPTHHTELEEEYH